MSNLDKRKIKFAIDSLEYALMQLHNMRDMDHYYKLDVEDAAAALVGLKMVINRDDMVTRGVDVNHMVGTLIMAEFGEDTDQIMELI